MILVDPSSLRLDDYLCNNDVHLMCLFSWIYIVAQMDETISGVFNLIRSSLKVQVDPCERCFGVEHGKTSPDYQPMM